MALNPSANDRTREFHAKELTSSTLRPAILDEEFPAYQALLDAAGEGDTPFTLPDMPPLQVAPSISGQKRGGPPHTNEDIRDSESSGVFARHASHDANKA